jgi:hypothetical protein
VSAQSTTASQAAAPRPSEGARAGDVLAALAERAVAVLDVAAAAVLAGDRVDAPRLAAWTAERARRLAVAELRLGDGPGLHCWRTGESVAVDAGAPEASLWPPLAREAHATGIRWLHAVPLGHGEVVLGALVLCCSERPLPGRGRAGAQALADLAALGVLHERAAVKARTLSEQLQGALDSRVVVEQAKGLVAGRSGVDVRAAFGLLRSYARNHNLTLHEVARRVLAGRLPVAALGGPRATDA